MGLFSRKKTGATASAATETENSEPKVEDSTSGSGKELSGPLDYSQVPDPSNLVDFGSVLIPPIAGLQITPEFSADNTQVNALTLQLGKAVVQLMVSSAPKSTGLWDEVRGELLADMTRQGATAQAREGLFGTEVYAQVPAATADGKRGYVQMRFAGIDGPNWFVRLVFNYAGANSEDDQKRLNEVVKQLVIRRDATPRPPREVLPLTLPRVPGDDTESQEG